MIKISHLEVVQIRYLIICQPNIVFNTNFCLNRENYWSRFCIWPINQKWAACGLSLRVNCHPPSSICFNFLIIIYLHSHFSLVPVWNIEENEKMFSASWPLIRERNLSREDVVTMMIPLYKNKKKTKKKGIQTVQQNIINFWDLRARLSRGLRLVS